jgi:CubicO group peptidase (beta-lactamase class C family)
MKHFLFPTLLFLSMIAMGQNRSADLAQLLTTANLPGIQLAYTHGNSTNNYNIGNIGGGSAQRITSNTIFEAASLSKSVFTYAVLRLYDRGVLDLDAPLLPLLGSYDRFDPQNPAYARITARMVLRHTTGLPNWGDSAGARLLFPPDSCFSYSGEGFVFLQKAVEKLTGKPLNDIAQEEVFTPLGMTSSSYCWMSKDDTVSAFGNSAGAIKFHSKQNAAYSLLTNAHDYSLYLQALVAGKGLKPATHQMMLNKATPANWFNHIPTEATAHIAWGLGVGLQENEKGKALWHWGDNGAFKAFYIVYPATQESLVYFVHDNRGLFITQEVLDLFFGPYPCWGIRWAGEGYEQPWAMRDFRATMEKEGFDKAAVIRERLVRQPGVQLTEHDLNEYGFILVAQARYADALAIFRLNVGLHPESANAYDSIAEAYEAMGEKQLALENFRRCVSLNPNNDYAAKQIIELQQKMIKK